jgi:hypothetical protein
LATPRAHRIGGRTGKLNGLLDRLR